MVDDRTSVIQPKPIPGFSRRLAVHLPVDIQSRLFTRTLNRVALDIRFFEEFRAFLLADRVVITHALSAPLAVMALERMIASGAREILLLGFAGSLSPDLRIGEAILIREALAEEGTSRHYFPRPKIFSSSPSLTSRIQKELERRGLRVISGTAVSTDAPYRETRAWISWARSKGAQVVDMETSAVFALAAYHRLQATALLLISDELFGSSWKAGFSSPALESAGQKYFLPFITPSK